MTTNALESRFEALVRDALPDDAKRAVLVGRVWSESENGPCVSVVRGDELVDISEAFPTMRDLCEAPNPAVAATSAAKSGKTLGSMNAALDGALQSRKQSKPSFEILSPIDLQAIKAAGVTFTVSMLERVIEERASGNSKEAGRIRGEIETLIGDEISALQPGSDAALRLKEQLVKDGVWSQYLEVGIGPDAEIFTKAQVLSSIGTGVLAGVHAGSRWNNPEPEIVLIVSSGGKAVGATLGNDVNLRDYEGRSALLLGRAKDNNASCVIGPFIRLFDDHYGVGNVEKETVSLNIIGRDGFELNGVSDMKLISRSPEALIGQLMGDHHQYPDGAALFLGTMFAPTQDRGEQGNGFTHQPGDIVSISAPGLGRLVSEISTSQNCPPWKFSASHLMKNLAVRGLL